MDLKRPFSIYANSAGSIPNIKKVYMLFRYQFEDSNSL